MHRIRYKNRTIKLSISRIFIITLLIRIMVIRNIHKFLETNIQILNIQTLYLEKAIAHMIIIIDKD